MSGNDAKLVKRWTGGDLIAIPVASVIVTGGYLIGFPPWWPLRVMLPQEEDPQSHASDQAAAWSARCRYAMAMD